MLPYGRPTARFAAGWAEAGSYIVEFDMPAYPGLYPSFLVVFPYQARRPVAFHKQLAATTNNTGNFTSSFGYLIMGFWPIYQSAPQQFI